MTRRAALAAFAGAALAAPVRVSVIAHRGEHLANPENTVAAIEAAIRIGVDYAEIDVRTTRDGGFVLMHNQTVDGTTNGKGSVASLSLAEIRALRTKGEPVPTFDEALEAMRGRCGVYLDAKRISAEAIIDGLTRHKMMDSAVVYGSFDLLKELAVRGCAHLAMPEAVSVDALRTSLSDLKPRVVAFDARDFRDDMIAMARAAGAGVFVDRLGSDDVVTAWEIAVGRGATGIQTDHPADLIAFLKRSGRRS